MTGQLLRYPRRALLVACVISAVAWAVSSLAAAQDPPKSRAVFMRTKLEFSKSVIEGLTTDNFELIEKNARALKRLSMAAEWEVPGIPNASEYIPQTAEFQRICDELTKAAKDKNIDAATVAYVRLTTNCVNCHKYVRNFIQ